MSLLGGDQQLWTTVTVDVSVNVLIVINNALQFIVVVTWHSKGHIAHVNKRSQRRVGQEQFLEVTSSGRLRIAANIPRDLKLFGRRKQQ